MHKRFLPILFFASLLLVLVPLASATHYLEVGLVGTGTGSGGSNLQGYTDSHADVPIGDYYLIGGSHNWNNANCAFSLWKSGSSDYALNVWYANGTIRANPDSDITVLSDPVISWTNVSVSQAWFIVKIHLSSSRQIYVESTSYTPTKTSCSGAQSEIGWSGTPYSQTVNTIVGDGGNVFGHLLRIDPSPPPTSFYNFTLQPISASELIGRWGSSSNASFYKMYTSTSSGFTLDTSSYRLNTTMLNGALSGLTSGTNYCAKATSHLEDGTLLETSSEACTQTLSGLLNFTGNFTRTVPDNVSITITRGATDTYYVDCVRFDSSGSLGNVCTADEWGTGDGNTYTFRYHQSLPTNTSGGDVGQYLVYVTNSTGGYLDGQLFCVSATYSASCNATVGTDLQVKLGIATIQEVVGIQETLSRAVTQNQEVSVQNHFLGFLDVLFRNDVFIPNILWGYILIIFIAAVGVGTNMRRG